MKVLSLRLIVALSVGVWVSLMQAGITERKEAPPATEASIAKALASQRVASLMPLDDIRRASGQGGGGGLDFGQINGGVGGKKTCVTNVGVTQAPQTGSRFGPGSTVAGDQRTVVIKGDIINICS